MPTSPSADFRDRNGVGSAALVAGIIAAIAAFVPIVGDLISVPAGIVAVVCGWIGLARLENGSATNYRETVIGMVLGTLALFAVFVMFAATHGSGG